MMSISLLECEIVNAKKWTGITTLVHVSTWFVLNLILETVFEE